MIAKQRQQVSIQQQISYAQKCSQLLRSPLRMQQDLQQLFRLMYIRRARYYAAQPRRLGSTLIGGMYMSSMQLQQKLRRQLLA